jgi:hypothetical protein
MPSRATRRPWSVSDDLTWLRGAHTLTMGGSFSGLVNRGNTFDVVPAADARLRHDERSGGGHVQRDELPGASGGNSTKRARSTRF